MTPGVLKETQEGSQRQVKMWEMKEEPAKTGRRAQYTSTGRTIPVRASAGFNCQ